MGGDRLGDGRERERERGSGWLKLLLHPHHTPLAGKGNGGGGKLVIYVSLWWRSSTITCYYYSETLVDLVLVYPLFASNVTTQTLGMSCAARSYYCRLAERAAARKSLGG